MNPSGWENKGEYHGQEERQQEISRSQVLEHNLSWPKRHSIDQYGRALRLSSPAFDFGRISCFKKEIEQKLFWMQTARKGSDINS